LDIRPQRGTRVKLIDIETVLDGRFVREAVEADILKKNSNKTNARIDH
jgi:DNA-binding GntR family transcriptional regulator